ADRPAGAGAGARRGRPAGRPGGDAAGGRPGRDRATPSGRAGRRHPATHPGRAVRYLAGRAAAGGDPQPVTRRGVLLGRQQPGRYPLFRLVSPRQLDDWVAAGQEFTCATGETIFQENTPGAWVYLVRQGRVRILRESGRRELTLGMLG